MVNALQLHRTCASRRFGILRRALFGMSFKAQLTSMTLKCTLARSRYARSREKRLPVVRSGNDIVFWNPTDGKVTGSVKGAGQKVVFLGTTSNGNVLVTALHDGNVIARAIPSGRELLRVHLHLPGGGNLAMVVTSIAVTDDGKLIIADDEKIDCWEIATKKRSWTVPCPNLGGEAVLSPDGKWFVTALLSPQAVAACNTHSGQLFTCPCPMSEKHPEVMALAFTRGRQETCSRKQQWFCCYLGCYGAASHFN